jgi:hypothetical protein
MKKMALLAGKEAKRASDKANSRLFAVLSNLKERLWPVVLLKPPMAA